MASYLIAAAASGQVSVQDKTLTASTVDTVTFDEPVSGVEVLTDGTAAVYFSLNGSAPVVSGQSTYKVPAASSPTSVVVCVDHGFTVVNLISSGTPTYSVTRAA